MRILFSTRPSRTCAPVHRQVIPLAILLLSAGAARGATYSVAGFSDTAVYTGINQPTDFAFLPDGRILILEKPGRVLNAGPGTGPFPLALDTNASVDDGVDNGIPGI